MGFEKIHYFGTLVKSQVKHVVKKQVFLPGSCHNSSEKCFSLPLSSFLYLNNTITVFHTLFANTYNSEWHIV